jgi:CMP-N,N'-diacetyllegionaminic acid synthase
MKENSYLAIIPARSGSKRLSKKNVKILGNKPLIAWSIESALECKGIEEVMVSTDSSEILNIAQEHGVHTPFLRSAKNSGDFSTSYDVVKEVLATYEEKYNKSFDFIVLLQPTSPFRTSTDIENAITKQIENDALSIVSVCKTEHPSNWIMQLSENMPLDEYMETLDKTKRSQDYQQEYRLNGAIYIINVSALLKHEKLLFSERSFAYEMTQENSIDIDDAYDFKVASIIEQIKREEEIL